MGETGVIVGYGLILIYLAFMGDRTDRRIKKLEAELRRSLKTRRKL